MMAGLQDNAKFILTLEVQKYPHSEAHQRLDTVNKAIYLNNKYFGDLIKSLDDIKVRLSQTNLNPRYQESVAMTRNLADSIPMYLLGASVFR